MIFIVFIAAGANYHFFWGYEIISLNIVLFIKESEIKTIILQFFLLIVTRQKMKYNQSHNMSKEIWT